MKASGFALKDKKELNLSDFKGVDLSSSLLNINANHASYMENFINKNGSNRKRNGWEELRKFTKDDIALPIFGVFRLNDVTVVHAGDRIFYTEDPIEDEEARVYDITGTLNITHERSQAFVNGNKLYIIGCGDYIVFSDFGNGYELRRVVDEAYIPTTTINIDAVGSVDTNRSTLDSINLLSKWRKNTLLGRKFGMYDETREENRLEWVLDSSIDENTQVTIEAYHLEEGTGEDAGRYFHWFYRFENNGADKTKLYLTYITLDGEDFGYLDPNEQGYINFNKGIISFNREFLPQIEGQANITVTFQHEISGAAKQITKCKFGAWFGINGQANKLFLSGNNDYPNNDYHTGFTGSFDDVSLLLDDFSYFPADNISQIGTPNACIVGYSRLSDNTQLILKDGRGGEPAIYTRTGTLVTKYNEQEELIYAKEIFNHAPCVVSEGCINAWISQNFNGDSIVLTKNGVMGIVLTSNLHTERVLRERSYSINEKLKELMRGTAFSDDWVSIVFDNKYFLTNGNGTVFIADSRFKFSNENDIDGSFNYEWWVWNNIFVKSFAILDDKLFFGTQDGRLCTFHDGFTDNTSVFAGFGSLSIDRDNNCFIYSEKLDEIVENSLLSFRSNSTKVLYEELKVLKTEKTKIYLSLEDILKLHVGDAIVGGKPLNSSNLSQYYTYHIDKINRGDLSIEASRFDEFGAEVQMASEYPSGWLILYSSVKQNELYITNVTDSSFQVKRTIDGTPIPITSYNGEGGIHTFISGKITHKKNVVSKWYTPIFDLGSSVLSKTLLRIILTTEPYIKSSLSIGYETALSKNLVNPQQRGTGFCFEDLDFDSFSFETGFASSYSVKALKRNFNYIMLKITSESDSDCSVNQLSLIYKINKLIKGVL